MRNFFFSTVKANSISPDDITAIANFHIICDEAVVNGSNVLTLIANRKTGINLNIQGTNLATLPADIERNQSRILFSRSIVR